MSETRTVYDPFIGADVQISDRLVDRLRGRYACGPHLPNGNPEFGWKQFEAPPIQHEAAARIEELTRALEPFVEIGLIVGDPPRRVKEADVVRARRALGLQE